MEWKVLENGAFGLSEGYWENSQLATLSFQKAPGKRRRDWADFWAVAQAPAL